MSSDGGLSWISLKDIIPSGEYFLDFDSSVERQEYVLRTNLNRFFYGRYPALELMEVKNLQLGSTQFSNVLVSNAGELLGLGLDSISDYSISSQLYPTGFLLDNSGRIGTPIKRKRFAFSSDLVTDDESFGSDLVPVFLGAQEMGFLVSSTAGGVIFESRHRGYVVGHIDGGSALITDVSSDGKFVKAILQEPFIPEASSKSPAILGSLAVSSSSSIIGDTINANVNAQPFASANLVLTGISGQGWLQSDVGKTIKFNGGSIYITTITNSLNALGSVIVNPTSVSTAATGAWSIYDFRGRTNFVQSVDQTLTVSAVSSSLATATLSAGNFVFQAFRRVSSEVWVCKLISNTDQGMYLLTNTGWGVIQAVSTANTISVGFKLDT